MKTSMKALLVSTMALLALGPLSPAGPVRRRLGPGRGVEHRPADPARLGGRDRTGRADR